MVVTNTLIVKQSKRDGPNPTWVAPWFRLQGLRPKWPCVIDPCRVGLVQATYV